MKYIVYQTINLINNKIYIGQHKTKDPNVFDGYIGCGIKINMPSSYNNPSSPLQYAVNKYGVKNFKRITLKICDTLEEALDLEAKLVNYEFIRRPDTYNAQLGGKTGYKYLPIYQFSLDGNFLKEWNTMVEAAEFYCISHTSISNAIKYKSCCKNYYWSNNKTINLSEFTKHTKTIFCYDANNGKFVCCYNSIKEASKDIGACEQEIGVAVKGGYKVKNYYFSEKMLEEYNGKPKISLRNKILYVYDLEGNFITELHNNKEICEYFNIKATNQITTAIRKESPYKKFQFSLEKVEKMKPSSVIRRKREIDVFSLTGDFIETMPTVTSCKQKYGNLIGDVLKGKRASYKNFIFKYKD